MKFINIGQRTKLQRRSPIGRKQRRNLNDQLFSFLSFMRCRAYDSVDAASLLTIGASLEKNSNNAKFIVYSHPLMYSLFLFQMETTEHAKTKYFPPYFLFFVYSDGKKNRGENVSVEMFILDTDHVIPWSLIRLAPTSRTVNYVPSR